MGRVLAVPRLCELQPGICLKTEEKAWKNLSQGSRRMSVGTMKTEYTERNIHNNKNKLLTKLNKGIKRINIHKRILLYCGKVSALTYTFNPHTSLRGTINFHWFFKSYLLAELTLISEKIKRFRNVE